MNGIIEDEKVRVLVADDDRLQRRLLESLLTDAGYSPVLTCDGHEAMRVLQAADAPRVCLLDWEMPGPTGPEICAWLRQRPEHEGTHVIVVTGRDGRRDAVEVLRAGANDHVGKPYLKAELMARVASGARAVALQARLDAKVAELQHALSEIHQLRGLLPICSHCHRIRDVGQTWHAIEAYVEAHTGAEFSHTVCDRCLEEHYPAPADPQRRAS